MKNPFAFTSNFNLKDSFQSLKFQEEVRQFLIPEQWHEVGSEGKPQYQNGWSASSNKHFGFRHLKSIACTHIHGQLTPGTETDGTIIFNLPENYRPFDQSYSYQSVTDVIGGAGARFEINNLGDFIIYNADSAGSFYDFNIIYPLDI